MLLAITLAGSRSQRATGFSSCKRISWIDKRPLNAGDERFLCRFLIASFDSAGPGSATLHADPRDDDAFSHRLIPLQPFQHICAARLPEPTLNMASCQPGWRQSFGS